MVWVSVKMSSERILVLLYCRERGFPGTLSETVKVDCRVARRSGSVVQLGRSARKGGSRGGRGAMGFEGSIAMSDAMGEARRAADEELRPKDFDAGLDEMAARRPAALVAAQNVLPDVPMLHFWW
jgi:hypothetical protein